MRWRKIAARLPGRSDDAVRNRWNRVNDEPTLLAGFRGGALALLEPSCFSDAAEPNRAAAAASGSARKRTRDGVRSAKGASAPKAVRRALAPSSESGFADSSAEVAELLTVTDGPPTDQVDLASTLLLDPDAYGVYQSRAASPNAITTVASPTHSTSASDDTAVPIDPIAHAVAVSAPDFAPPKKSRSGGKRSGGGHRSVSGAGGTPARIVWSHEEDFVILRYVKEHGHDWKTLAEQLASRTPHAIRNRYHRLQTMALDTVEGANELLGESMLVDPACCRSREPPSRGARRAAGCGGESLGACRVSAGASERLGGGRASAGARCLMGWRGAEIYEASAGGTSEARGV